MKIIVTWKQFDVLRKQVVMVQEAIALLHGKGEAINTHEVKWDKGADTVTFELPDED